MGLKIIRFFQKPELQGFAEPKSANFFIPDWYKKAEASYIDENGQPQGGLKVCIPYLDAMTSGYMLTTPVNIYVNENNKDTAELQIRWDGPPFLQEFIKERSHKSGATMPRPAAHYPNHLVWQGYWTIRTPKNYSLMFTHPLNRHDLPFTTMSGFVDSDKFFASGNIPFFIKQDFVGIIPAGTPIAQLIPIKRDSWTSVVNDKSLADKDFQHASYLTNKDTSYKKRFWQRKRYE